MCYKKSSGENINGSAKEVQPEKELNASREKPSASGKGTNII